MTFTQFFNTFGEYLISGVILVCSFIVNIIQAVRTRSKSKLKDALCRIPEIIRSVEVLYGVRGKSESPLPLPKGAIYADVWSITKKSTAESMLINEFGERFFKKYKSVLDDAIEDILNTPQKKGGTSDVSKESQSQER